MLAVRPKKMASKDKEKIAQFQVGDNIVTTAGIVGIIKNITDSRVFVEVSDGVVLEMYKQALFHKVEENLLNSPTNEDEIENTEDDSDELLEVVDLAAANKNNELYIVKTNILDN